MSGRQEFVFSGCRKPIVAHPRMPSYSIHVTAVLRSPFVVLPTLRNLWEWLMSLVRIKPLLKKENSFQNLS